MQHLSSRFLTIGLLLAMLLAGCGQSVPGMGAIQERACEPLLSFEVTIEQLTTVTAEITVGDVRQIKAEIDSVVSLLRTANQALNSPAVSELLTSYDALAQSISGLPDDQPIGESAAEIQAAVKEVQSALNQAMSTLNCDY